MTMEQSDGKSVRLHLNTTTTCKFVFVLKNFKNSGKSMSTLWWNYVLRNVQWNQDGWNVQRGGMAAHVWTDNPTLFDVTTFAAAVTVRGTCRCWWCHERQTTFVSHVISTFVGSTLKTGKRMKSAVSKESSTELTLPAVISELIKNKLWKKFWIVFFIILV